MITYTLCLMCCLRQCFLFVCLILQIWSGGYSFRANTGWANRNQPFLGRKSTWKDRSTRSRRRLFCLEHWSEILIFASQWCARYVTNLISTSWSLLQSSSKVLDFLTEEIKWNKIYAALLSLLYSTLRVANQIWSEILLPSCYWIHIIGT